MITMRIDNTAFRRDLARFRRKNEADFKRAILDATNHLVKMAKLKVRNYTRNAKVKSGNLINNIIKEITGKGLTGVVISRANYSQAFEEGTRPHGITIRNKKVLAGPFRGRPAGWLVSPKSASMGYATYGKKVQHPGTPAHPFMFPAWRYACQLLEKYLKQAL